MNKLIKNIITIGIIFIASLSGLYIIYHKIASSEKIHYHAGFVVFKDNIKLDFSDDKYMFIKPCSVETDEDNDSNDDQIEKAHLHDNVGDIVHIESSGARWKDLFTNIGYPIDYLRVVGYINKQKVTNIQNLFIKPFDSLVVFIGVNDLGLKEQGVTRAYIEEMSQKSKGCND